MFPLLKSKRSFVVQSLWIYGRSLRTEPARAPRGAHIPTGPIIMITLKKVSLPIQN
jgi:hypothetical protein